MDINFKSRNQETILVIPFKDSTMLFYSKSYFPFISLGF
jgi:hypothetical protein